MSDYSPFFDQEAPQCEVDGMIASQDKSEPYELDAAAVFKCGRRYLVVFVSGCSCWPDRGSTRQVICHSRTDVDRELNGWMELSLACQNAHWKVPA